MDLRTDRKERRMNVGVIGQGFVGGSLTSAFREKMPIQTYDVVTEKSTTSSLAELVKNCDIVFVCLPTPMTVDGRCYTGIVENTLEQINDIGSKFVITKSTVPPGTHAAWSEKYSNLSLVFNPEFLTEKNAQEDFNSQEHIIFGCKSDSDFEKARVIFSILFPRSEYIKTSYNEAESIKYFTNAFLSTKVSFCNEFSQMCERMGVNYNLVATIAHKDKRLGNSHYQVPGPDGDYGFGGHCFPKDLNALMWSFRDNKVDCDLLEAVWNTNLKYRENYEWLSMDGRAIIKKEK